MAEIDSLISTSANRYVRSNSATARGFMPAGLANESETEVE